MLVPQLCPLQHWMVLNCPTWKHSNVGLIYISLIFLKDELTVNCWPAHFCLFFTRDKFEVRQRCKICQIYWFLVPGIDSYNLSVFWQSEFLGKDPHEDDLPDTMPNSFCNNPALQCVLVHQWLEKNNISLYLHNKLLKVFEPILITCAQSIL